ncbi:hypothetical protein F5Y12DRAFT_798312 [Xylaria sp. FL1777]|nr:hypothetical protein F5Y12DRAFT_798312 [Xylaria sp. FL1777]
MCKPDSLSNPAIKRPITLKKQEGPDVTMSLETSLKSASQLSLESIQERVFLMLLPEIGTILREKTVRAASVMGSTHSYSTQPDLIISDIREKIGHLPSSTAKEVKQRSEAAKEKVLFDLMTHIFGDFKFQDRQPSSTLPLGRPQTPTRVLRVEKTQRSAPVPKGPTHLVCHLEAGASQHNRSKSRMSTADHGTPTRSSARGSSLISYERSGMIGRHSVYSRVSHYGPPPTFKLDKGTSYLAGAVKCDANQPA